MNGRSNKVKFWLESISADLSSTYNIFSNNLISKEDIGETEKHMILKDLNHLTTIIDDIIFKLDGGS